MTISANASSVKPILNSVAGISLRGFHQKNQKRPRAISTSAGAVARNSMDGELGRRILMALTVILFWALLYNG
jgi:hypothetical protein